jgi:hypothetical protein
LDSGVTIYSRKGFKQQDPKEQEGDQKQATKKKGGADSDVLDLFSQAKLGK